MTDKTEAQPEALRLADRLDLYATGDEHQRDVEDSAAELRRLHAESLQLRDALTAERDAYIAMPAWYEQRIKDLEAQLSARQAAPDEREPIETVKYWRDAYANPQGDKHFVGHGMVVKIMDDYLAMLSAAPPPPEREPLSKRQVSKIALDLLMTNCTWHALQNTGFFHEIVPFTVEIVAAAECAHGIGATNDNP